MVVRPIAKLSEEARLTRSAALEYAPRGIRINAVSSLGHRAVILGPLSSATSGKVPEGWRQSLAV
jgi:hypothetical protein